MAEFSNHPVPFEQARAHGQLRAIGLNAHDGDTITARLDLGFAVSVEVDLRIAGVNTPEIVGTTGAVMARAREARDFTGVATFGRYLLVTTHRARTGALTRSFERYVADVLTPDGQGGWADLATALIAHGLGDAVPATGR
jgi:endonuclease YncB( thermonuclease family)